MLCCQLTYIVQSILSAVLQYHKYNGHIYNIIYIVVVAVCHVNLNVHMQESLERSGEPLHFSLVQTDS